MDDVAMTDSEPLLRAKRLLLDSADAELHGDLTKALRDAFKAAEAVLAWHAALSKEQRVVNQASEDYLREKLGDIE